MTSLKIPGLEEKLAWPVAHTTLSKCEVFAFLDRVSHEQSFDEENYPNYRSIELLGGDQWKLRLLSGLLFEEPPLAMCSSSWHLTGLSRLRKKGRTAWAQGLRWSGSFGKGEFATIPAGDSDGRRAALNSLGSYDEQYPECVLVPHGPIEAWDKKRLARWCWERELFHDPGYLIPEHVELVFAFFNGWVHVAAGSASATHVMQTATALAHKWNLTIMEAPRDWAWPGL